MPLQPNASSPAPDGFSEVPLLGPTSVPLVAVSTSTVSPTQAAGLESGMVTLNLNTTSASPAMNPFSTSFPSASPATTGTYSVGAPLVAPGGSPPSIPSFPPPVHGMTPPLIPLAPMSSPQQSSIPAGSSAVTVTATATPLMTDITAGASPAPLIPMTGMSSASDDIAAAFQPTPIQPIATS
ncbi:hypothetical protein OS493_008805 [Desmophyllum pertusum]|uniref:Peptidase C31 domain-containing protein n=1 Tax=Desmophyllum pertusum TaxID=174260 RepID=A0A9X0CZP6_9CNID|nr:hypothetical protein OS493_008805 [Desmophyllum pertusum]